MGVERTVSIEGTVSNVPSVREGSTALASRMAFDHGGHLIAARCGGPTCDENLVPPRRQSLLACRDAPLLENLYSALRTASAAAPAFRSAGL